MFTGETEVDLWSNRVEDYLDDTRRLLDHENTSYEVRVAHDLLDVHDYAEVAKKAKSDLERQTRHGTLKEKLLDDEKLSQ